MSWGKTFAVLSVAWYFLAGTAQSSADTRKEIVVDFTRPEQASTMARWTGPEDLRASSDGLGCRRPARQAPEVAIEMLQPTAVGWSRHPATFVRITAEVALTGKGLPAAGQIYARYSPDRRHWSTWQALDLETRPNRKAPKFFGTLRVPRKARETYEKLLKEFAGVEGDFDKIDQEAAVHWIVKQDPKFFARTLPFVGYVDFLWETSLPGETRLKKLEVSVSYGPVPEGHQEEGPWRFGMPIDRPDDPGQTLELSETDDGKTVQVKLGTPIIVRLAGNPATGYGWETLAVKGDAVKQTGEPDFRDDPAPPGRVGGGGGFMLPFKAVRLGKSTIQLGYRRPWERNKEPHKTFNVTVEVK